MIIPIDKKYRIRSDDRQWIVEVRALVKDKETGKKKVKWRHHKFAPYHITLEHAIKSLMEYEIRSSNARTLAEALAEFRKVGQKYSDLLQEAREGVSDRVRRDISE